MQLTEAIETPDALRIAGVSRQEFHHASHHCGYPAPPLVTRRRRLWGLDDVLRLTWFDALVRYSGHQPIHASRLVAGLRSAMEQEPDASTITFWGWDLGNGDTRVAVGSERPATVPDTAMIIMEVPVALWRKNVSTCIANYYAQRRVDEARKKLAKAQAEAKHHARN